MDEEAVLVRGAGVSSPAEAPPKPRSGWASVWYYLRHPVKLVFRFGMRQPGQHDDGDGNDIGHTNGGTRGKKGKRCLDLDQLALPGVIEHDISLTRRDWAEGDNIHPQPDLIEALLASSSDGGVTLSARDLAGFRRRRIAMQREANPGLRYRELEHFFACCEIALLLGVLGDGERVRCDYVKAFFAEERLPVREGWMRRPWWRRLGLFRVVWTALKVRSMVGVKV